MKSNKENKFERVRVSVRVRPFLPNEKAIDPTTPIESVDTKNNIINIIKEYDKKTFTYDHVYPEKSTQSEIFDDTSKEVVKSVLKGYNGTIFAYGQTGTGKTYTMVGDFKNNINKGIIPRSFDYIFDQVKQDKEHKYNIVVSFIQIYIEQIQDLLDPSKKEIRIREDPEKGVYLEGVTWVKVSSTNECGMVFSKGEENRTTHSTLMNAHSSRSHAIFIAQIEKSIVLSKEKIAELSKESNEQIKAERVMTKSFLYLVDLAGSERVKKTKAVDIRLEEAKKINFSLLTLGKCINGLTEGKQTYISYRESKLTRLLQESLGGNAKTSLIVTISPSNYNADETISSLNFASRAMKVKNKPIINKSVDYQALCIKLQEDLDKLNDDYTDLKMAYDKLAEENEKLKNGEVLVELQKKISQNIGGDLSSKGNNISSSNPKNKDNLEKEKEKFKAEIKKLETFYQGVVKNKTEEYENVLKDIDKIVFEKEQTIEKLIKDNKALNNKNKTNEEIINDYKKEKEDLMNSITDLTNKLNYEQESKENKSVEEHKKQLDALNSQIELLEKKIIPLENMNSLNTDSINLIQNKIDNKIKLLKEEKNNLQKEKSNNTVKISQNDIKIKLCNDEKNNIDKRLPSITDEMKTILTKRKNDILNDIELRQLDNAKINELQEDINNKLNNIEDEIKKMKQLKTNMGLIGEEEISKVDKTEIFCLNKLNETNSLLMNKRYEENNIRLKKYLDNINEMTKKMNDLNKIMKMVKKENMELTKKNVMNAKPTKIEINDIDKGNKNENNEEKDKKINEYETQINDLKKEISILNKNLILEKKNSTDKNSRLMEDNNKLLEDSKIKINKLSEENNELRKNLDQLKLNNIRLNNDLKENMDEISRIKNLNERDLNDKISGYEAQLEYLNKELQSKEKIINDSITINEKMNTKSQVKEEELKKLKTEKNVLNDRINNYELKILQLNNEISNKEKIINENLTENENWKQKVNESEKKIKKLENVYKMSMKNINDLKNDLKEKSLKLNLAENNLNNMTNNNKKLLNELKNKNNNIKTSESELLTLNNSLTELNKTNEQLSLKCDEINEKYKNKLEEYESLNNNFKKINEELNIYKENSNKLNIKINSINNEMKLLYKKNESLSNELNEKEKLFGENLGKNEVNMKLLEDYKNKLNNLKKENLELNKNNILINENNDKLKTNIKLNSDEIDQLKNQIEKELLPKINNYEAQINLLTKENKAKEKIINANSSASDRMNISLNKNLEELKNLKNENEQNNKEIQDLNKEINLLKIKLLDKEKEVSKLKEEIKNINDDNQNQKDEFSNELNILNKKLTNQQSSNDDYIKKIEELNSKIKNLQNESNKLTEKNTELLNEALSYKDKINNLNESNQKLKIENSSQQQALTKLTSLSKNDNETKKNALTAVKELNKKITEYLLIINNKENEIKNLKDENFKNKNEINELNMQLKNKSDIESQIDELKKQQNQSINVNSDTNTKLNILSYNCDEISDVFNKFQTEIESIQTMINTHKNNDKNIDLSNLNKLIDEENENLDTNDVMTSSSSIYSKKSLSNGKKNLDLNDSKNRKLREKIKNKPMELCMNNINEKVNEAKNKFLSLINSYYNSLTHINKKNKEKEKIHSSISDLSNNLLKTIVPNLENFEKLGEHYERKIKKSKTDDEIIFYVNKLINDIINKLKDSTSTQKEEIDRLHDRVEFFIKQCDNIKKTQEIMSKEEKNNHKLQAEKYERQIKKKEEELNKMKMKINEKELDIDEGIRKNNDLSDELLNMKEKYNIQAKDIENIDKKAKEQINKSAIKALNTGKYAIKEFLGKVRQFADDLYNYSEMKPSG